MTTAAITDHQDTLDAVVLSVIAPCLNEEGNIDALTDRTLAVFDEIGVSAELILVDDGSTDATWQRIERRAAADQRVRGVRHESNRGMEQGWLSGCAVSQGDLTCLIDADLQNRPEDIAKLYKTYIRELPDLVQAVRHLSGGPKRMQLFSRGLNFVLNATFGTQLRDNKSGFILCRRDVLVGILEHRYRYRYFQSFIGVAAHATGYTTLEVDTQFDQRLTGSSFLRRFPIMVSLRILGELLKYRIEVWTAAGEPRLFTWLRRVFRRASWPARAERREPELIPTGLAGTASGDL